MTVQNCISNLQFGWNGFLIWLFSLVGRAVRLKNLSITPTDAWNRCAIGTGSIPVITTEDLWSEITSPSEITCLRKDTGLATQSDSKKSIRVGNTFVDYNIGVRVLRLIFLLKLWRRLYANWDSGRKSVSLLGSGGSSPLNRRRSNES